MHNFIFSTLHFLKKGNQLLFKIFTFIVKVSKWVCLH